MHGPIVYGHQEVLDPRYMGEGSETGAFKEGNNGYYIDDLDAIPYLYHLSGHHWAYQKGS
jgi:alpha-N-acetylglucosamine transferase